MWLLLLFTALADDPWPQAACDMPGANLEQRSTASALACEEACREREDCGGYTFVTGMDRCSLELPGARSFPVRMHAAARRVEGGIPALAPPRADHDHRGKDLEAAPRDLATTAACAKACEGEPACVGYVYIEGYRACWLKATEGALVPKRFVCASRPEPAPSP